MAAPVDQVGTNRVPQVEGEEFDGDLGFDAGAHTANVALRRFEQDDEPGFFSREGLATDAGSVLLMSGPILLTASLPREGSSPQDFSPALALVASVGCFLSATASACYLAARSVLG